jgi:SagB-type dehydrogenase family enzyme
MKEILKNMLTQRDSVPDTNEWPESWKTVIYKIYERAKNFSLHNEASFYNSLGSLGEALLSRRSADSFSNHALITEEVLGILRFAAGVQEKEKVNRTYASGGVRYPVEIYYLNIKGSLDFPSGMYHFSPKDNSLSFVKKIESLPATDLIGSPHQVINQASGIICFTSVLSRATEKYGWLGVRLCLIDVGQILQNIALISSVRKISYRPIAGFSHEKVDDLLQIDGKEELSLLVCALG